MANIIVDHEKLAHGLETGMSRIFDPDAFMLSQRPTRYRLRLPACGTVSSAIKQYADSLGIDTGLYMAEPQLKFDHNMQHVVPVLEHLAPDPFVVDANYSQFLGYVGMSPLYEELTGQQIYPSDRVISFRKSEVEEIVSFLTRTAVEFRASNLHPKDDFGLDVSRALIDLAGDYEVSNVFRKIYDLESYNPWQPPNYVIVAARDVSRHILPGSIEVV